MIWNVSRTVFLRTVTAVATVACSALGAAYGQQGAANVVRGTSAPTLFASAATYPMDLANLAGVSYSSSLSESDVTLVPASVGAERLSLTVGSEMQPPPRRYGRPRYNDNMHNADGSNKYGFEAGGGLNLPNGNTFHYYNTSWAFSVGGGRNFNKNFSVNVLFDYDHFGVNGGTIRNQQNLYNTGCSIAQQSAGKCTIFTQLDANAHIWDFSLNPTYNFITGDRYGAYVVAGVGFYHKVTNFTTPQTGTYYDPYYGPITYLANSNVDHYTSNAPGFSGGFGLTYKASRFAGERFFVEGRYVFVDNSQRAGITLATPAATANAYTGTNYFPANSNRTAYIPIKVGVRF